MKVFSGLTAGKVTSAFFAIIGSITLGLGGWLSYLTHFDQPQYAYVPTDSSWREYLAGLQSSLDSVPSQAQSPDSILIDIGGGVKTPGVYQVSNHARVQDVVLMADGFLPEANQEFIHQKLNLSAKLQDQQKIYIPLEGESYQVSSIQKTVDSASQDLNAVVNLNLATPQQLESLPGIGPVKAAEIVANRPYSSAEDLVKRGGLSATKVQELLAESATL